MITLANYEEYMIMYADRELRPQEEQELVAFVTKHPHLKKELDLFEMTRVKPNPAEAFPQKKSLLRSENGSRTIGFPNWKKYSIAAGIAALIVITTLKFISSDNTVQEVVKSDISTESPKDIPAPVADKKIAASEARDRVDSGKIIAPKPATMPATKIAAATKEGKEENVPAPQVDARPVQTPVQVNELPLAKANEVPHDSIISAAPLVKDLPAYAASEIADNNDSHKSFWDKLPIDETKKKQMKNIAGAVTDVVKDVSTARQDLYKKSITIKIEKRRLIISF